ncbi:MAG: flagellin FliC [Marinospirillum sp.]|uniref:flagellin N-terminal helical domain-containing protein n=1 Tax=Marinospirillum sp. TaxID=2183934 RepID=UPI001A01F083|nr:flagellin [Marinospirillum sp.]MBE0508143.1 flagellin FliC [Marinospirillum sp.]
MSLVINTNVSALNGARNLANTQAQQSQTFNRLSTGLRINSAKDDAGGLYLAQAQTKDIRGLNMATRNAGDGISLAQTAEGALDQITSNLQRINELAIQSANGTYNTAARGGLQKEVDQLTQEITRIIETTEFNGQKLLNASAESLTMQVGFDNDSAYQVNAGLSGGLAGVLSANVKGGTALALITAGGLDGTATIDITTQTAAQSAISLTRNMIDGISTERATFGAVMNRFEAVISGNQIYSENLQASRSRVQDADFAAETSNLAKQQVLQQAGVAALGQANASSQVVLGLL